ncbi:hypothetical protein [Paenibacillus sp. FSL H3-0286]|uniref:hypothetical protein n=1 Tax=Paenibacillus sp. FSL H3-0286 TaxID=2921427 RepID=UPI00324CE1D0
MSLAISASKPHEHWLAVDTAISFRFNGERYRHETETTDGKIEIIDGEAYFFSGDMELVKHLKKCFVEQKDRSFNKLCQLASNIHTNLAEEGDELAFAKYGFDNKGIAYAQFSNNYVQFKPGNKFLGHRNNRFLCYGASMNEANKEISNPKYLSKVKINPEFFIPIYEAISNEGVGKEIIVYRITKHNIKQFKRIPLNEPETIKKASVENGMLVRNHYTFENSGNAATPRETIGTGDNLGYSKVVNLKYAGGYKSTYYQSNYGKERSIDLKDEGITMLSDDGFINLLSKNMNAVAIGGTSKYGTDKAYVEMTPDGKINFYGKEFNYFNN